MEHPDQQADDASRAKTAALKACVERMKAQGLKGKARDDAAVHFLVGAASVAGALGIDGFDPIIIDATTGGYVEVLEALASAD